MILLLSSTGAFIIVIVTNDAYGFVHLPEDRDITEIKIDFKAIFAYFSNTVIVIIDMHDTISAEFIYLAYRL